MKKLSSILLSLVLLFSLTACGSLPGVESGNDDSDEVTSTGNEYEDNAIQLSSATTYYNEYLGIAFTVDSGWWLFDMDSENMSENTGVTDTAAKLAISRGTEELASGDYNYEYMFLFDVGNLQYSSKSNQVYLLGTAEKVDGITTLDAYADYYVEYYEIPDETDESWARKFNSMETVTINGKTFKKLTFNVEATYPYSKTLYITEVNNGYMLVINGNYWDDNTDGVDIVESAIESGLRFI